MKKVYEMRSKLTGRKVIVSDDTKLAIFKYNFEKIAQMLEAEENSASIINNEN